jgi:hypothetical protein
MSALVRRSCWFGAAVAAVFSATLAIVLVVPGMVTAASANPHTTSSSQVPNGSNGVNHNDMPLPPNPNCTDSPGTSGVCSSPQPFSTADQNNVGANTTSSANAYVSTRNGAASDNGNGNGTATGKPCAGCVGKADNKFPPGQAPNGPAEHNNGYECDGNNGIGQTNPAHTGCQAQLPPPPPTCETCQPPPPCPCTPPPPTTCLTPTGPTAVSGPTSSQGATGTSTGAPTTGPASPSSPQTSTNVAASGAVSTSPGTSAPTSGPATTGGNVPTSVSATTGEQTTAVQGASGGTTTSPSVLAESGTATPSASVLGASGAGTGSVAATASPSSGLAFTGFSELTATAAALALLIGGLLLVMAARRRTT